MNPAKDSFYSLEMCHVFFTSFRHILSVQFNFIQTISFIQLNSCAPKFVDMSVGSDKNNKKTFTVDGVLSGLSFFIFLGTFSITLYYFTM